MSKTRVINVALVSALGALAVWLGASVLGDDGEIDGPVIAVDWNDYPTAEVIGELRLVEDCLLIDDAVAFWAEGTSWDTANESVVFEDAASVHVGEEFSGGGGFYTKANLDDLEGFDTEAVIECMNRTGSTAAVVAKPSD